MLRPSLVLVVTALCLAEDARGLTEDTFSAVVVEYSPASDPSTDAGTNLLNNVHKYVDIINTANNEFLADIIVFPEIGLRGYGNQIAYLEIPDPADQVIPCARNTSYEAPLVQLSCAARATATYVVVNLDERFFNSTSNQTCHFNTDVVFNLNGAIVARYRKIHLFKEADKQPSLDKELVYFDTSFGVRFGIFTCFDIIFYEPGVEMARNHNISYFIFPTAWFSELPFLTAIQQQWQWSYSLNVVLLAAGYNLPSAGSSGTGIYLGRRGPAVFNMTDNTGSFMLHYDVPRTFSSTDDTAVDSSPAKASAIRIEEDSSSNGTVDSNKTITFQKDFLEVYATKQISIPEELKTQLNGSEPVVPFIVKDIVCYNTFCCSFYLNITSVFNKVKEATVRGDDYSTMTYRLAAFDGVRPYADVDTGGLQTCAIIPCVNGDLKSCGLRADDPSAEPNMVLDFYQTAWIFEEIIITGFFSVNDTLVGPNILVSGEYDNFGALVGSDTFTISWSNFSDSESGMTLTTRERITNLVTASLYGRVFSRDGQPYTRSSALDVCVNLVLLFISIVLLVKYSIY